MKLSFFSKMMGLAALSLSMTLLPMTPPASAQDVAPETDVATDVEDDGFDWGLLGLLGLIGLAGLAGKKNEDAPTRYRDPAVSETEYRR